jgi:hypothetical protein
MQPDLRSPGGWSRRDIPGFEQGGATRRPLPLEKRLWIAKCGRPGAENTSRAPIRGLNWPSMRLGGRTC